MVSSLVVMGYLTSVEQGWKLLIGLGAGTGLVFILRWYWWRINAWSEISAMVASFVTSLALTRFGSRPERHRRRGTTPGPCSSPSSSPRSSGWPSPSYRPGIRRDPGRVLPARPSRRARVAPGRQRLGYGRRPDPRRGAVLGELGRRAGGGLLRGLRASGAYSDRNSRTGAGLRRRRDSGFLVDTA